MIELPDTEELFNPVGAPGTEGVVTDKGADDVTEPYWSIALTITLYVVF